MKQKKIVDVAELCIHTTHPQAFIKSLKKLCDQYAGEFGYKLECDIDEILI